MIGAVEPPEHRACRTLAPDEQADRIRVEVAEDIARAIEAEADRYRRLPFTGLTTQATVRAYDAAAWVAREHAVTPPQVHVEPTTPPAGSRGHQPTVQEA